MIEGLRCKPIAKIGKEYQISQSLYYQWRDQFISRIDQIIDISRKGKKESHPGMEILQLKPNLISQ